MRPELIVAGKEFRDHVTSKRFLVIFAILLLICAYALVTGMDQYHKSLDDYKKNQQQNQQQPWFQEQVQSLQKQLQDARDRGAAQEIENLQFQLDMMLNPPMPSVMNVFSNLGQYFSLIGMVLGIALGFDLITREKEEGSLKSLLSHPVYRDAVINGKTLGAIAVLFTAMGATFLITVAIVLFFGVVPSADEFLRIVAFFSLAVVFCLAFFAVAIAASAVAKTSSMAVLYALGVVLVLVGVYQFSPQIVQLLAGPAPEPSGVPIVLEKGAANGVVTGTGAAGVDFALALSNSSGPPASSLAPDGMPVPTSSPADQPAIDPIAPGEPGNVDAWQKYYEKQEMIRKAIEAVSPMASFQYAIAPALTSNTMMIMPVFAYAKRLPYGNSKTTVWDSLGTVWVNILVLLAEMLAAFAVAYVKFLRTDIR